VTTEHRQRHCVAHWSPPVLLRTWQRPFPRHCWVLAVCDRVRATMVQIWGGGRAVGLLLSVPPWPFRQAVGCRYAC